jgi:hypothetical protein
MWWLIQNILFSVCLIVIVHYLYIYFETTLTTPKVKDLIHCPKQEYKLLLESIHKKVDGSLYDIPVAHHVHSSLNDVNSDVKDEHQHQHQHQHQQPPLSQPVESLGISTNKSTDDMKVDLKEYIRELALKQASK